MHERFLAVPLCRLGAFEQEEAGLDTPLRGCISVGRCGRRGDRGSRGLCSSGDENRRYSPVNLGVADVG